MDAVSAKPPASVVTSQSSPWHTPVPYLFGGLAAMMGLIAFALLVLACSYYKLSGFFDDNNGDVESGNVSADGVLGQGNYENRENNGESCDMQEKCLVIMAGEDKPTFLATPSSSRTGSFGSSSWRSSLTGLTESATSSTLEVEMLEQNGTL